MWGTVLKVMAALMTFTLLIGCAAKPEFDNSALKKSYKEEIARYKKAMESKKPSASLYATNTDMYLDYKARKIGDLIIVNIAESASASNSNATNTSRTSSWDTSATNILGLPTNLGVTNFLGKGNPFDPTITADASNSFTGNGTKSKADSVTATVAARIIEILPSGNFVIEGHREIIVDKEKQVIKLSGIIRERDIAADNTVASTAMADARISYSGKGVLTDANTPGWLSTLLSWILPF